MSRLDHVINDSLFDAYWDGVRQLGTDDLVIYYREGSTELRVIRRLELLADLPPELSALRRPARETDPALQLSTVFWLVATLGDELIITAVHAKRIGDA